jgi:nitrate/nitrite transporter NarK
VLADAGRRRHPGGLPGVLVDSRAFLAGTAAAGGIALINSIGNLAGFVAPYMIGALKTSTGSLSSGLYFVAALEFLASFLVVLFVKKH